MGNDLGDACSYDWGTTPESASRDDFTALVYRALERDDAGELRRLATERPDWRGGDVFHDAVRWGSVACVKVLLALLGGDWANEPDECGSTPLMYAAQGDLVLVKLLVEAGADPNALAEDFVEVDEGCRFRSALFWAALAGRRDVVEYLAPLTRPDLRQRIPELIRQRREQEARGRAEAIGLSARLGAPNRSNAMPTPVEDPVLGRLTWEKVYERWTWTFAVPLADGNAVRAYTLPDAAWDPLSGESLPRIRALVEWLRGNEPSLRAHVAAEMFEEWRTDYWDPDTDGAAAPERLPARLRLIEVTFIPDGLAYLWYDFDSASGPGQIRLGLDWTGAVAIKPGYPW